MAMKVLSPFEEAADQVNQNLSKLELNLMFLRMVLNLWFLINMALGQVIQQKDY